MLKSAAGVIGAAAGKILIHNFLISIKEALPAWFHCQNYRKQLFRLGSG